jgi:hypothetical protein
LNHCHEASTAEENVDMTSPSRLRAELELYEAQKTEWLKTHRGEFVVIKSDELLGFFGDFHTAYSSGAEKYGIGADFLVKRLVMQEPVFVVF